MNRRGKLIFLIDKIILNLTQKVGRGGIPINQKKIKIR